MPTKLINIITGQMITCMNARLPVSSMRCIARINIITMQLMSVKGMVTYTVHLVDASDAENLRRKMRTKKCFYRASKLQRKTEDEREEWKQTREKKNVIEHLCVDLLQSHKHLSQAISHNEFDFDAVQKSALLLSNLLHFFCSILNSVHFILVFFGSSKHLLGWNRRESSVRSRMNRR